MSKNFHFSETVWIIFLKLKLLRNFWTKYLGVLIVKFMDLGVQDKA